MHAAQHGVAGPRAAGAASGQHPFGPRLRPAVAQELGGRCLRDGKRAYLKDLPLVIRYALEAAQGFEQGRAFYDWFIQRIEPLLPNHDWYRDWHTAGDNAQ